MLRSFPFYRKAKNTMIPLPSSRSSEGSASAFEIGIQTQNRGRLRFSPFMSHLSNEEFLRMFHLFIKAVQEGKPTQGQILGRRKLTILAYNPTTRTGGTIRLERDGMWVEIHPMDFLTILLDHIGPGDRPYGEIMDTLLPHAQGGAGTLEERAAACLQSLAATHRNA